MAGVIKVLLKNSFLICHQRTHTGEKPLKCNQYNKGFACKKIQHVIREYIMGNCLNMISVIKKSHKRNHVGHQKTWGKLVKYNQCHKCFDINRNFIHSQRGDITATCVTNLTPEIMLLKGICGYTMERNQINTFIIKRDLINHQRKHTGEMPYQIINATSSVTFCFRET